MSKRIAKELAAITGNLSEMPHYDTVECADDNILMWNVTLLPQVAPFNRGAFKYTITFPPNYPFKAPSGAVCLGLLKTDNWKPATNVTQVLAAIANLIDEPNPSDPINNEAAKLYVEDIAAFNKRAAEWVKTHAIKR